MQNAKRKKKRKRKTQTQNVHKCIYVSIHKTRLKRTQLVRQLNVNVINNATYKARNKTCKTESEAEAKERQQKSKKKQTKWQN